jgi:hypothetical protein
MRGSRVRLGAGRRRSQVEKAGRPITRKGHGQGSTEEFGWRQGFRLVRGRQLVWFVGILVVLVLVGLLPEVGLVDVVDFALDLSEHLFLEGREALVHLDSGLIRLDHVVDFEQLPLHEACLFFNVDEGIASQNDFAGLELFCELALFALQHFVPSCVAGVGIVQTGEARQKSAELVQGEACSTWNGIDVESAVDSCNKVRRSTWNAPFKRPQHILQWSPSVQEAMVCPSVFNGSAAAWSP